MPDAQEDVRCQGENSRLIKSSRWVDTLAPAKVSLRPRRHDARLGEGALWGLNTAAEMSLLVAA